MNYPYTIDDLASKCQVSKQSIYGLIKKYKDFVNENSRRQGRKIKYNQAVLDMFLEYYGGSEQEVPAQEETLTRATPPEWGDVGDQLSEAAENLQEQTARLTEERDSLQQQLDEVKQKLADSEAERQSLAAEIDSLRQQLQEKEGERHELLMQNGALILTLQQEKQEKILYLTASKKTLGQRIKSFFSGKKQEE